MINFLKYWWIYATISAIVLIAGIVSLSVSGLIPSVDFVGGTTVEIQGIAVSDDALFEAAEAEGIEIINIQDTDQSTVIRTKTMTRDTWSAVEQRLATEEETLEVVRFEIVGPILGRELLIKTLVAALIAVFGILSYIAWAFKDIRFGISAIVAMFHDVLVVTGLFSIFGYLYGVEVDVLFVTAILTTMSFSVHDTIVVFDRIRESLRRERLPLDVTINKALTETMTRSINNSLTIIFMLLALALLGGDTIQWFVVALLIGTISGTYSSPFVATPTLHFLLKKKKET